MNYYSKYCCPHTVFPLNTETQDIAWDSLINGNSKSYTAYNTFNRYFNQLLSLNIFQFMYSQRHIDGRIPLFASVLIRSLFKFQIFCQIKQDGKIEVSVYGTHRYHDNVNWIFAVHVCLD